MERRNKRQHRQLELSPSISHLKMQTDRGLKKQEDGMLKTIQGREKLTDENGGRYRKLNDGRMSEITDEKKVSSEDADKVREGETTRGRLTKVKWSWPLGLIFY